MDPRLPIKDIALAGFKLPFEAVKPGCFQGFRIGRAVDTDGDL
jgi:hypothetical protein